MKRITALVGIFEGQAEVALHYKDINKYVKMVGSTADPIEPLLGRLKKLVGEENVVVK